MIRIDPHLQLDESEIKESFILATGPGGQKVNKVSSGVQLRFDILNSPSLPPEIQRRLISIAGKRVTDDGVLVIVSRAHRSQRQNRREARQRLIDLIAHAAIKPKTRLKSRPTKESKNRRLFEKHHRSETKRLRRESPEE